MYSKITYDSFFLHLESKLGTSISAEWKDHKWWCWCHLPLRSFGFKLPSKWALLRELQVACGKLKCGLPSLFCLDCRKWKFFICACSSLWLTLQWSQLHMRRLLKHSNFLCEKSQLVHLITNNIWNTFEQVWQNTRHKLHNIWNKH